MASEAGEGAAVLCEVPLAVLEPAQEKRIEEAVLEPATTSECGGATAVDW